MSYDQAAHDAGERLLERFAAREEQRGHEDYPAIQEDPGYWDRLRSWLPHLFVESDEFGRPGDDPYTACRREGVEPPAAREFPGWHGGTAA